MESPLRFSSGNSSFLFCCDPLPFISQVIISPILALDVSTSDVIKIDWAKTNENEKLNKIILFARLIFFTSSFEKFHQRINIILSC